VTRNGLNRNAERWRVESLWFGAMTICPVWALQGLYVRAVAMRLPRARGPREGETGEGGRVFSLAVVGDSTVAGVGAATQDLGLAAQIAEEIRKRTGRRVRWQAVGKNGATAARAAEGLVSKFHEEKVDLMAVALGVNDVLNVTSVRTFRRNVARLVRALRRHSSCPIIFSGLPPLHLFSVFPQPLRGVLGLRARLLDGELQALAHADPGIVHAPVRFPVQDPFMACDGFHPSEAGYREWARQLTAIIVDNELIAAMR
jgi:lysophospholipase L1-like esterase